MKRFRLFKQALIVSTLFVSPAQADKGVFNAKISPDEFFTHTATTVTVSAEIGAENAQLMSIAAYQTNAQGQIITKLGDMVDDASHGDNKAADTVFTAQFNVNRPTRETLYVRVMATYKDDRMPYLSQIMTINTYEPLSSTEVEHLETELKTIKDTFLQRLSTMPIKAAREQAYRDTQQNPRIAEAKINAGFLSIMFKNGVRGSVTLDGYNWPSSTVKKQINQSESTSNDKVLIFAPGYSDDSPQNEIADYAQSRFNQSEYLFFDHQPVAITKDSAASLELIKHWGDYETVILHTHGGVWGLPNAGQEVFLQSGTASTGSLSQQNSIDLSTGRIGLKGVGRFVIFPAFIDKYAVAMRNTFFYLGACNSLSNDTMWQALKNKGAKVAFGWSDTVARGFNADRFKDLIDAMLPSNSVSELTSAKAAYEAIPDKTDGWCLLNAVCLGGNGASLTLKTASSAWNSYVFSDHDLINGDFETGDWTGWVHGGDYAFRLISGAKQHHGKLSAALGRWDTDFQSQTGVNRNPNGYEWFYQDVVVPRDKKTLQFYWGMETYNTAHWDWFNASIQDTNGKTLKSIFSHAGKVNDNAGYYASTGRWQQVKVDISAYRGQKIRLYFEHRLNGITGQQRVYIDDMSLQP